MILVFSKSCLHAVSSLDGEVIWKIDLTENRYFMVELVLDFIFF